MTQVKPDFFMRVGSAGLSPQALATLGEGGTTPDGSHRARSLVPEVPLSITRPVLGVPPVPQPLPQIFEPGYGFQPTIVRPMLVCARRRGRTRARKRERL